MWRHVCSTDFESEMGRKALFLFLMAKIYNYGCNVQQLAGNPSRPVEYSTL